MVEILGRSNWEQWEEKFGEAARPEARRKGRCSEGHGREVTGMKQGSSNS